MAGQEKLGEAVLFLSTQAADLVKGIGAAKARADDLQDHFTRAAGAIKSALGAIGLGLSIRAVFEETVAAEDAQVALASAVQATGAAAGFTADQLMLQASALQEATKFSDESIMDMQAALLSFRNIQGEVFKGAEKAVLDFAAATRRDPVDAARTLGLALNSPAEGVARLTRAGVSLNAGLRETIKTMAENGQVVEAQRMLLDALAQSYGGRAAAAANTLSGALAQLKNKFSDTFLEVQGPVLTAVTNFVKLVTDAIPKIPPIFAAAFAGVRATVENLVEFLFVAGKAIKDLLSGQFSPDYLTAVLPTFVNPIKAMTEAYRASTAEVAALTEKQRASFEQGAAGAAGLAVASERGLAAVLAAQQTAISASQAVGDAIRGPLIAVGMTYDELVFRAQDASMRAQQAAALAQTTAQAGYTASAEAAKRVAEGFANDSKKFSQAAQASLAQLNASILSTKQNSASAIGGMVAAWAQGSMSFKQFVTGMILEIGKLIAKLLILKAVSSFLSPVGGSFLSGVVGGIGARAEGGPVSSRTPYIVGERGPELFVSDRSGYIVPNEAMGGGGGMQVSQHFNIAGLDLGSMDAARRLLQTMSAHMRSGLTEALAFAQASQDQAALQPRRAYG